MKCFLTAMKRSLSSNVLLVMKLTALFFLIFALHVSATGFGQEKINLRLKKTEIAQVLRSIEQQTTYRFLYNNNLEDIREKVTIRTKDASLPEVLNQLLQNTRLAYQVMNENLIVIKEDPGAPIKTEVTVRGVVTGDAGVPLTGASIQVKGTSIGTTTNVDGRFTLNVPDANATLVISSVGYDPQEIPLAGRTDITVSMTISTKVIEQVVVVGYGTARRRDVTGATASISGAQLAKQPVLTPTQALQGKIAGVQIIGSGQPNSLPVVRIRGTGTMLAGSNPLFVVDGVITDDIRNINNADIVSVDVLKDASATAIYGMRAANGVLLITTKKGRTGKMVVSYDANAGVREATKLVNMAGPQQYAGYLNEASLFYGNLDSTITSAMLASGGNTDWYDAILRTGFQQNHNVSVSGGNENVTYFLSAGFLTDEGVLLTNKFNRFTLRSNNEYRLNSAMKLSTLISYSRGDLNDADFSDFTDAYRAAPYVIAKQGNLYGNTSVSNNVGNPLLSLDKEYNKSVDDRLQGTAMMDIKPLSWLTFRSSFGVDLDFNKNTQYNYAYGNSGPNNVFITPGGNQLRDASNLRLAKTDFTKWVWDNTLTATKRFGDHNFTLLVGATSERYLFNSLVAARDSVSPNRDLWYLNTGPNNRMTNEGSGDKWTRNSYISRLNYGFKDRYLLTATLRADGTSRFPEENRWGYFPSVGLGWVLSEEGFMSKQKTFDNLKLRASWGRVGNDLVPTSSYIPTAVINIPYFYGTGLGSGIAFDQIVQKDLKWEISEEFDFGVDFTILNNRLNGVIDFYDKKTKDALINVNVPAILGDPDGIYVTNAASFRNRGVEVSLGWNDKIGKDWTYSVSGNVSFNQNKIIGLNGGQALPGGNINDGFTTLSDNGHPIGSFYLWQTNGVFQSDEEASASGQAGAQAGDLRYVDQDKNGVIDGNDRVFMGSYQPKMTMGFNGDLGFKGFDLSIGTYGAFGGKIYNGKKALRGTDPRDNIETSVVNDRWTINHRNTNVPRATSGRLPNSDYFLENADFFRINNLTIGYKLPQRILDKYKIQSLRFYATVQNLFTFTGYSGFTPELIPLDVITKGAVNITDQGVDVNAYPSVRTWALGVNLTF
jgi:TonB-linked SusC/RagA family outer membrane protein